MTPYQVIWEPDAEQMLADIWLDSADPNSITTALAEADRFLSHDPFQLPQHLSEGLYRIDVPPLVLTFTIEEHARIAKVTWVWHSI